MAAPIKATRAKAAQLKAERPAESATAVLGAVAFLAGRALGWDSDVTGAVTLVVCAVPTLVTWYRVRHGS